MLSDTVKRLDAAIDGMRDTLARDTIRLINIPSFRGEPEPGAPFGKGPRAVLDEVMAWGKREGFFVTDYGVGVVSLALREGQPDLGIWAHGDVVPVGDGWSFPPFEGRVYKDCVIGRGATDNKGQLCASFHLLKLFRDLEIPLRYNVALYVGSDEESGMHDIYGEEGIPGADGFLNVATPPRLSLVPDSSFPVGYGGRGKMLVQLRAKKPIRATIAMGQPGKLGLAEAELDGEHFEAYVPPRHGAHPSPDGNALTKLTEQLLARELPEDDRKTLQFLHDASLDIYGAIFGIDVPSENMGRMTLNTDSLLTEDGRPELTVSIRHVDSLPEDEIFRRLKKSAEAAGFETTFTQLRQHPYLMDRNDPKVDLLTVIANEIRGEDKKPYTLSGATYANRLPNAYAFGMGGCKPPEDFPKGKGGAHGVDECVSLDRLQSAMRIYARSLLALNECEW